MCIVDYISDEPREEWDKGGVHYLSDSEASGNSNSPGLGRGPEIC